MQLLPMCLTGNDDYAAASMTDNSIQWIITTGISSLIISPLGPFQSRSQKCIFCDYFVCTCEGSFRSPPMRKRGNESLGRWCGVNLTRSWFITGAVCCFFLGCEYSWRMSDEYFWGCHCGLVQIIESRVKFADDERETVLRNFFFFHLCPIRSFRRLSARYEAKLSPVLVTRCGQALKP